MITTWQELSCSHLLHNLHTIQNKIGDHVHIIPIVKANAYGHGMVPIMQALLKQKIAYFGVSCIEEGLLLRKYHSSCPILVINPTLKDDIPNIITNKLTPIVSSFSFLESMYKETKQHRHQTPIHIKVDTGMGRGGFLMTDMATVFQKLSQYPNLLIKGLCSHFASAEHATPCTHNQLNNFCEMVSLIPKEFNAISYLHVANSGGVLNFPQSYFNAIRLGLLLYGISPIPNPIESILKPVMQWKTRLVLTKQVPANHGVSYGSTFITSRPTTLGILPVGYRHGFDTGLSNCGEVIIKGKRVPIVGRVCMDQSLIDITDVPCQTGDEVVLLGCQDQQTITVQDICNKINKIPHEFLSRIAESIPKIPVS